MDSFYIVLPSNTLFPGNTTSQFTVKLPNIIDLTDGNWSVALSSIIYPLTFSGVEDEEKITINYEHGTSQEIAIPRRIQYNSVKDFERSLNEMILAANFDASLVSAESASEKRRKREANTTASEVDKYLDDIVEGFNSIKMIKSDIEAKLNSISDEQLKQNLNASKNEFEHVYKKAKSTEFLAKAGKGSFDQAKKMKNIDEATKFSKNIEEMKNKFYDAENGFKHSAEKIRDRIVHEIENWKKPKDEGKFKKYLNDITDSFKIVKKMKEEIEHKFSSVSDKQLKEKLNSEKEEFNKVYENAKSTEWLARAGEATLNAAIQGKNNEQIEKASKQIEGMKDKFLGDGKVKGFRQVAQTLRDKIINEIEKSEKLTKKGTTRVSALAPTQPTPPPTQPTPPPTQPTPPPRPPSSKLAPPAKSAMPPAAAPSSQQPRASKFTPAPPAPKSTESPKSESTKQPSSTQTVPAPKQSLPKPAPAPAEAKPPSQPPIALAQISRPIAQPRKAEEPPPPPRAPKLPPPPPPPPDLSQRPVAKPREVSTSRRTVQPRKPTLSEDDQKRLDTALKVATQSIMDIDDTMVEFQRIDTESDRTVENMHAKYHTVLVGDSVGKKYMEIVHHNRNVIQSITAGAERKANDAKAAKIKVEEAHKAKKVNEAQTQTNVIKDLKREIVEDLKPRIEKAKDLMLENYGKLLEWEQEEILNAMNSKAKELLREVETAYSVIHREHDILLNIKKELDGANFEKNSVGDRLKNELLKEIKEADELFRDKAQKKNHEAILERIAIEEAMSEKKGDAMEEIIDRLQSYRDEFMGDEETIGLKSAIMNISYQVSGVFNSTVKLMIQNLKESPPKPQEMPKEEPTKPSQEPSKEKPQEKPKPAKPPVEKAKKPKESSTVTIETFDEWPIPEQFKKRVAIMPKQTAAAQPKTSVPVEMEIELDKADQWPTLQPAEKQVEKQESEMAEKRKGELSVRIAKLIDVTTKIGKYDDVKRSEYQQIYFHYDDEQMHRFFLWAVDNFQISNVQLSKQLAYVLGFEIDSQNIVKRNEFAKYSPDIAPLHSFYVYAPNLVANTVIGDTYGPLLRIVNVRSSNEKVTEIIYSPENFVQVLSKHISEIRIEILSDAGRPIEFNSGNCILTLHFKRALF